MTADQNYSVRPMTHLRSFRLCLTHTLLEGLDIYGGEMDLAELRQKVGMVFQKPNPFPQSVFNNVAFGPKVLGLVNNRNELAEIVEESLRRAAVWEIVKDDLEGDAMSLSLGEQQRLCIARVLAVKPEVILMDEPASALDPVATLKIEELIHELKELYTIVIVTHNMQQASRISDYTALMYLGRIVEEAPTEQIFEDPQDKRTQDYIFGRFG